jgi:molecular chaperone GrpE
MCVKGEPTSKPRRRVGASKEVRRLQEEIKAEQAKSIDYLNRLKYLQADFENYRKRVERNLSEATQRSNERLIANLLSVMDDLERAIETGKKTENIAALSEGVEIVYRNLFTMLDREGLTRIETVGKPFDPNVHEILARVPSKDHKEGTVIEEVRKGFIFKGKVMRPSIVKITCKEEESEEN